MHPETGFTVLSVKSGPQNKRMIVLGDLSRIKTGQQIRFYGEYCLSDKHGRQFRAVRWEEIRPETKEGLVRYLAGQFNGIGPKLAQRIVDKLGVSTLDVIEKTPEKLKSVSGIGREKFKVIVREWSNKRALAEAFMFLSILKLGPLTAQKIIKQYGYGTEALIREDPFRLATEIRGLGFASADDVAARLNIRGDDFRRLRAAIRFELERARDDGHTCLPRNKLVGRCATLLDQPGKTVNEAIDAAKNAGDIIFCTRITAKNKANATMVFDKSQDWIEQNLAQNMKRIYQSRVKHISVDLDEIYIQELKRTGLKADPIQREALVLLQNSPIFIITGGPGTGKTTLVRILLKVLQGLTVKLAAPTGRAAQRMTETSGMEAATLHRLLEFMPQTGGFNRNVKRPLKTDVVIADESSMIDTSLAAALLRALKKGTRLILVGDVDQLPSVGPGRVLADLIESEIVPVIRLNRIYRQVGGSHIIMNAHRIIRGQVPVLETHEGNEKAHGVSDFVFIEKDDPQAALDVIERLPERIAHHLGVDPVDDIQVLSPMHRGTLGVQSLNEMLRKKLNPVGQPVPGPGGFRVGDKVMQIKNNYDLDVFNGDVGRIIGFDQNGRVQIRFAGHEIGYLPDAMGQIMHAFACSIHKSQGSEYPAVIIPVHTQHYVMLRRQLLYTAVTRGKQMVVIVGSKKALRIAVKNTHENTRYTLLKQRLHN
ncbi:ATP-dependent RecD-like DNA helicase [bacterium]|nr:ATP-dependent RecD-like DNA helicase [bacterium]